MSVSLGRTRIGLRLRKPVLILALLSLSACSVVQQPTATADTYIGTPVAEGARQTFEALNTAAHVPQDRYADAVAVKNIPVGKLKIPPFSNPTIGDHHKFYVNFNFQNDFRQVPTTLRYISENGAWWVADNAKVTDRDLRAAAEAFENNALKIDRLIYGHEPEPGIDGYDHINFLFVNIPEWGEYYGYFSVVNQFPTVLKPYSNQTEMLVLNTGGAPLGSTQFTSQLAHEFGHLIHWTVDPNEDLWMNEAFSEMAAFLSESPPTGSVMNAGNQQVYAKYPFIQLNTRPDTTVANFDRNIVFAHYGAEKLLMVYLLDRFGPRFIKDLIANPDPGLRALDEELGKQNPPLTFNQVYADWILANLMNQPDHPQGHFGYSEVQTLLPSIITLNEFTGETLPGFMRPYSVFYYELHASDKVNVNFKGDTMASLTAAEPFEGQYGWYSNRGDETSFTLTRSFDLTNVRSATLNYRVWYDLEKNYDYGYVLASENEGKTWAVLPTKYGKAENLSEDAYGMGYTGVSKVWLRESLDLSDYAGKKVMIRFVVNTDLATNLDGMMLDNIEIPEIHYFDGAEDEKGDWTAQGFVRSTNTVPVDWIVWIIKVNNDPNKLDEVTRVKLDDLQSADFDIDGFGKTFDFAAMVIAPTASTSTTSVNYEFALTGK
jgi:immune inhibitor A